MKLSLIKKTLQGNFDRITLHKKLLSLNVSGGGLYRGVQGELGFWVEGSRAKFLATNLQSYSECRHPTSSIRLIISLSSCHATIANQGSLF